MYRDHERPSRFPPEVVHRDDVWVLEHGGLRLGFESTTNPGSVATCSLNTLTATSRPTWGWMARNTAPLGPLPTSRGVGSRATARLGALTTRPGLAPLMQSGELGGRVDAEFVGEDLSRSMVGVEGIGLAPLAVERQHQLAPDALPPWVLREERLGIS